MDANTHGQISTGSTTFAIRRIQPPLFKRCQDAHWVLGVLPGRPLPLAPPCNRQRPFVVAGDRQGFPLWSALHTGQGLFKNREGFDTDCFYHAAATPPRLLRWHERDLRYAG